MGRSEVRLDLRGIDEVLREEPGRVEAWLDGFAEQMVSEIKLSFGTSPAGESYQRGGVTHVASQAGYPPNVDTGALSGSIRWERDGALKRKIMDGVEYGLWLEDGTESIRPRPFMGPAFDWAAANIEDDAARNLRLDE